jgi:hypothetical protein
MHLGFVPPLSSRLDDLDSLDEAIQALERLPKAGVCCATIRMEDALPRLNCSRKLSRCLI